MQTLSPAQWRALEKAHRRRVEALAAGHLDRRERGVKHPVEDFLWVYYPYRPGRLRRWHPGAGIVLAGDADPAGRRSWRHYRAEGDGVTLDVVAYLADRGEFLRWIARLLAATAARPPTYSCFGLHEWAMVYGLGEGARRHEQLPLRLGQAGTDAVVRDCAIRCSHYDAYRFFTPAAAPRNELRPRRDNQAEHDQPGCLHATMDLYKWSVKLGAAVPGDLMLDAFDLARDARALDMAASPYDVRAFGLAPVPVETAEGRAEYVARQRELVERGTALRARLLAVCDGLMAAG